MWIGWLTAGDERQAECEGLPRPRRGTTADVLSEHYVRDGFSLNFERFGYPLSLKNLDQTRLNAEV